MSTYQEYLAQANADIASGKRKQLPLIESVWNAIQDDSLTVWEREQVESGKAIRDGSGIKLINPDMVDPGRDSRLYHLEVSASESCAYRGHTMAKFETLSEIHSRAVCKDCGMYVDCDAKPPANGIDIGGQAVALNCPTPSARIGSVEINDDGSKTIRANGDELRAWANKAESSWPCSELATLDRISIKLDRKGDLVECEPVKHGNWRREGSPIDIPGDELTAWQESVLAQHERREIIRQAIELDSAAYEESAFSERPGRYEASGDLPLVVAMAILDGVSGADDSAGSTDELGYGARFGRYLLRIDSAGFHSVETFDSVAEASKALSELNLPDEPRYIVRGTDHAQNEPDTISRPEVFDTLTGESVGGSWALNDWDRARAFANELNEE